MPGCCPQVRAWDLRRPPGGSPNACACADMRTGHGGVAALLLGEGGHKVGAGGGGRRPATGPKTLITLITYLPPNKPACPYLPATAGGL